MDKTKRMTHRYTDGAAWASIYKVCACGENECKGPIIDRLAAYEDTGLEPCEVEAMKAAMMGKSIAEIKEFDGVSIDHLRELVQAKKEDRLVDLPCRVGDPVWWIDVDWMPELSPKMFYKISSGKFRYAMLDWSNDLYLSREDAEKALAQRAEEAQHGWNNVQQLRTPVPHGQISCLHNKKG